MTQSVDDVQTEVRNDVIALIGVGVVALLLGLGVAWLLAGSLAKPLRSLASTARRVAGGNLDSRAEVTGSSEQREVATAFNDMTARLGRSLTAQREFVANASHQLRTPLTGLRLRLEAAAAKSDQPRVRETWPRPSTRPSGWPACSPSCSRSRVSASGLLPSRWT